MATPAPGARPTWWPTQTDLGAMVGLARCGGRQERGEPCARPVPDADEPRAEAASAALAARLSGLLRTGC